MTSTEMTSLPDLKTARGCCWSRSAVSGIVATPANSSAPAPTKYRRIDHPPLVRSPKEQNRRKGEGEKRFSKAKEQRPAPRNVGGTLRVEKTKRFSLSPFLLFALDR